MYRRRSSVARPLLSGLNHKGSRRGSKLSSISDETESKSIGKLSEFIFYFLVVRLVVIVKAIKSKVKVRVKLKVMKANALIN